MGSRISEECSSKCISAQKNCYLWWAMKLVMKKRSIYFPLWFFCDTRRKILVTVEEAVVKPKPLNVSNTKKRGKKCAHRWNSKRQLGFPATEKPCCLPQGIITCQVTRLNIHFTMYHYVHFIHKPKADQRHYSNKKTPHPRYVNIFQHLSGF